MTPPNAFDQVAALTTTTTRIALTPGERVYDEKTNRSYSIPAKGAVPIVFDIHSITPNESILADAQITAKPPQLFEDQPSPKGVGRVNVMVGYDYDDPGYIAERQKQLPLRNAHIIIMGCPALRESAPGDTIAEKAKAVLERFPAFIVEMLALNIENISIYNRVGNDEVASFLAEGSGSTDTTTSKNTRGRSQAKKKSPRSSDSTGRTSS